MANLLQTSQAMLNGATYTFHFNVTGGLFNFGISSDDAAAGLATDSNFGSPKGVRPAFSSDLAVAFVWQGDSSVSVGDAGTEAANTLTNTETIIWDVGSKVVFISAEGGDTTAQQTGPLDQVQNTLGSITTIALIGAAVYLFIAFDGISVIKKALSELKNK